MENKKHTSEIEYVEPADYFPKELRQKYKLGEYADPPHLEKIKAVMLGHAVGDALGVPVEFCSREELDKDPVTDMRGFGTYPVPAGSWSDDTSMSLATLDALTRKYSGYNDVIERFFGYGEIMDNFVKWYTKGKYTPLGKAFDIGGTCLGAISQYRDEIYGREDLEPVPGLDPALEYGSSDEYSNGNGSLMRIHPLVLHSFVKNLPFETWRWIVEYGSMLTHAHDRSIMGCLIYAFVLLYLLSCREKRGVMRALREARKCLQVLPEFLHYSRIFSNDFADLPREKIKSSGYVVDTLEAALWCLLTTDSYRECVLKAVNLGKDTDTVAAVAGGLAGALYGYEAIPTEWLDTLKRREYIETLCQKACESWKK